MFWPLICLNGEFINNIVNWMDLPTTSIIMYHVKMEKGYLEMQT